ncbi:uncharacterized protein BT62DRAFT_925620 [Guyanagaster necrorhizus]|uniref:Uncharacterized protein n=1 Tax=Guyanagaster necrorhizus TaxID=856835 RepID=A0A9P8AYN5_9AGAR|nr:uncharacterized protein BT62DRAFT_925620 [Guyanagaster necrorhizus MCA 3950]KAG7453079.1 hypothetical protein BT62DRAFT_925620 [Guyanagaster necrorhizus MCA 3950]
MIRLPASFTSLYRLFLRTTSASVLHHPLATRNLRNLWRSTFHDAAKVIHHLHHEPPPPPAIKEELESWLSIWNNRGTYACPPPPQVPYTIPQSKPERRAVDNTLALLHNSSHTRGLSHQLTRNLALLVHHEYRRVSEIKYPVWNPQLPADSKEYQIRVLPAKSRTETKRDAMKAISDRALSAVSKAVRMAEGRDGVVLGSVAVKGKLKRNV